MRTLSILSLLAVAAAAGCGSPPPKTYTVGAVPAEPGLGAVNGNGNGHARKAMDADSRDKSGVWVELYEGEDFDKSGLFTRVYGPGQFVTLEDVHGHDWDDEVNSVIVGPGAQVTLFRDEDFEDDNIVIGPGQKVPRLRDYQLAGDVQSMRIQVAKAPEPSTVVVQPPATVVAPVVVADASAVTDGVWVDLFESTAYSEVGAKARLKGPAQFPDLRNVFGRNWKDKVNSIVVGPDAEVVLYDDENFQGERLVLAPGQRLSDLEAFDLGNDVESLKVMKARSTQR